MTLTERAQAAARKYHESWHYRLPEQFRDVRPADPNVPPQPPSLPGGADPFAASIWRMAARPRRSAPTCE